MVICVLLITKYLAASLKKLLELIKSRYRPYAPDYSWSVLLRSVSLMKSWDAPSYTHYLKLTEPANEYLYI